MRQVHVCENLCPEALSENMKMCEILQANVLIEKFSSSYSDYTNQLKYRKKDLTLQELIIYMRIEEANRLKNKMDSLSLNCSKANQVQSTVPINKDIFKGKGKKNHKPNYAKQQNKFSNKIQKPKGCTMPVATQDTKHISVQFAKGSHSGIKSLLISA